MAPLNSQKLIRNLLWLASLALASACQAASSSSSSADAGSPSVPPADCQLACAAKYAECGGPSGGDDALCTPICAQGPSASELACLGSAPCLALSELVEPDAPTLAQFCGTSSAADAGVGTECSGTPRCEGSSVVVCKVENGIPVTETTNCESNETCSGGKCEENQCIENGQEECNPLNSPNTCCDPVSSCTSGTPNGTVCCHYQGPCVIDEECCFGTCTAGSCG